MKYEPFALSLSKGCLASTGSARTENFKLLIAEAIANRPSRDGLVAARQALTHEWFAGLDLNQVCVSNLVVTEISRGDPQAAARRMQWIEGLAIIPMHPEASALSQKLMGEGIVPPTEPEDALHIALATVHGFRYLVTWNFSHFVGAEPKYRVFAALRDWGYTPALLVTPEELMIESS